MIGGDPLTYIITVNSDGFSDAQNVVVTDILPAGVTLVSTSGDCDEATAVPTCTLGTMPANTQRQYTVTVDIDLGTSGIIPSGPPEPQRGSMTKPTVSAKRATLEYRDLTAVGAREN